MIGSVGVNTALVGQRREPLTTTGFRGPNYTGPPRVNLARRYRRARLIVNQHSESFAASIFALIRCRGARILNQVMVDD